MKEDRELEVEGLTREGSPDTAVVVGGRRETEGVGVVWRREEEGRELMGVGLNPLDMKEGGAFAVTSSPPLVFSLSSVKSTTTLSAGGGGGGGRRVTEGATLPVVRDW